MNHVYLIKIIRVVFLSVIFSAGMLKTNAQDLLSQQKAMFDKAEKVQLAKQIYWQKLLHYSPSKNIISPSAIKSALVSKTFFLADKGSQNPSAELNATLSAMLSNTNGVADNAHAQCRFPARFIWLKSKLPSLELLAPKVKCTDFSSWSNDQKIKSISLFFASGYLDNPASYYGHILMRFNTENDSSGGLLSTSMDYGAIIPEDENPVVYIIKGLFGGYKAGFTHQKFYHQNHNYGSIQLRDLWEYELALDDDQQQMIIAHSWELLGNKFTYYFLRNNCAYAMAEMVELVTDQSLFNRKMPWVIPQSIFHSLDKSSGSQSLVKKMTRHLSLQTKIYNDFKNLTDAEKRYVDDFSRGINNFSDERFHMMEEQEKGRVLAVLLHYYQYRLIDNPNDMILKKQKQRVLIEQLERKIKPLSVVRNGRDEVALETFKNQAPNYAQRPTSLRVGAVYNPRFNEGLSIQYRPAYFDKLSADIGRPANSQLMMGNLEFVAAKGAMRLTRFDIVDVEAMGTSVTNLPGDGGRMWKLNIGVRRQNLACDSCLTAGIEAGMGKSFALKELGVYYGIIDSRLQSNYKDAGLLSLTPRIGFISAANHNWKMHVSFGYRDFVASSKQDGIVFKMEHRFGSGRTWDIRASYEYDKEDQLKMVMSRYF